MFNKLKQIKDLKSQAKDLKNDLSNEQATGEAIDGKVKVILDGNQEIIDISIDETIFAGHDKSTLEQGIKDAFIDAQKEIKKILVEKVRAGGMNIPDMGDMM